MQNILIIGATSAIAEATARLFARQGAKLYLLARNKVRLESMAADLKIRGASSVDSRVFDANDLPAHKRLLEHAFEVLGDIDIAFIAHGTLGDQKQCESSTEDTVSELHTNAVSTISLLTVLANMFERQRKGDIVVISSVAGDRGRPSNYVYGSSKAAVTTFCEGLRARLHKAGVHLLLIKPGMVKTPMTEGLEMPQMLVSNPSQIAKDILKAIKSKKDILYTPWYWRLIMSGIVHIPVSIFKRFNL